MGDYSVIGDVSETLIELLRDRITGREGIIDIDRQEIALASPGDDKSGSDHRVTLYLYGMSKSAHMGAGGKKLIDGKKWKQQPLALELQYLLTVYPSQSGTDRTAKTKEQHTVLGLAMQVLHDNSIISGTDLKGSLVNPSYDEQLHITMKPQPGKEAERIWKTFQAQPRPSISYTVSPVLIESAVTEEAEPPAEKGLDTGGIESSDEPFDR